MRQATGTLTVMTYNATSPEDGVAKCREQVEALVNGGASVVTAECHHGNQGGKWDTRMIFRLEVTLR